MKKIIALFLCLATLLPLCACGTAENKTETAETQKEEAKDNQNKEKDTIEPEEIEYNHKVEDLSAPEKLAAIPIAKSSMSEMELRQICVDFFQLMATFTWIPSETLSYKKLAVDRVKGKLTAGIPYISTASGNLYRAMEIYDPETGVLDLTFYVNDPEKFGNACSGGAFWSWFRVVNSMNVEEGAWTQNCTHLNGCLRVGPYTYKDVQNFHVVKSTSENKYTAENATKENTEQIMYQSYAATKIADGVVHPGHVRMVTVAPTVVTNPDGTINGDESWLACTEQIKYVNETDNKLVQSDGTEYMHQGFVDKKYTFKELYEKYYIPFSFAEFLGTDPVEDGSASLDVAAGATMTELSTATLTANYSISDVWLIIRDAEGTEVLRRVRRTTNHYQYEMELREELMLPSVTQYLKPYAEKGGHTITFEVQISNGEKLVAYTGPLVP